VTACAPDFIVTDIDGCLLDNDYSFEAARPALAALARAGCPLVLCSGKTRAEMQPLALSLGLRAPFIVENGGAIILPCGSFDGAVPGALRLDDEHEWIALGAPRRDLVRLLRQSAAAAGVAVRSFDDLDARQVSQLTGLSECAAALALERDFDEPFVVDGAYALEPLEQEVARRGLTITHGGRFHHLQGGCDKGLALRTLRALYARVGRDGSWVGLGDAQTDLPLLRAVERPIVVPGPDGHVAPVFERELPEAERAPAPGPQGWNAAILRILAGDRLPRVADPA
jgi:mannosyl-3-phosphoglycerate phosphatase